MRPRRRVPFLSFDRPSTLAGVAATAIAVTAATVAPAAPAVPQGAASASPSPSPSAAPSAPATAAPVHVLVPYGLTAGFPVTSPSRVEGEKYVTVEDVRIVNPSRVFAQSYTPADFHLLAADHTFTPVVRPGFASLDLSSGSVLGPGQTTVQTVTFRVPAAVTEAKFEFVPHWQSDAGGTVDYCCLYY